LVELHSRRLRRLSWQANRRDADKVVVFHFHHAFCGERLAEDEESPCQVIGDDLDAWSGRSAK